MTTCSTEFASKKEGNYNVMITRPIKSHDLGMWPLIWSWHVTYKLHPDIKASLILTSASLFVQTSSHHRFQYPRRHSYVMTTSWSTLSSKHAFSTYCGPRTGARRSIKKTTSRSTPISNPVIIACKGSPWSLLIRATGGS